MELHDLFSDDLRTSNWLAKVIDDQDPDFEGKVKVRVFGKFDDVADEDLPWARPSTRSTGGSATGSGFHSVPKVESVIGINFDNGDIYEPEYFFIQHVSDELKAEIQNSYANAQSLIYDTVTEGSVKIFFTEEKGLMLDYKENQINIKPDNTIVIKTKENVVIDHAKTIELGKDAAEKLILGDSFMSLYNNHTHIGNLGVVTSPPTEPMTPTNHLSGKGSQPVVKTV
jgi:hypothetical protein